MREAHPFRDFLRERDPYRYTTHIAMTDAFMRLTRLMARQRKLRNPEVLEAILATLVNATQAGVPPTEWSDVGLMLAEELRARLTITGDTGDHHRRWQI